jgi:proteic killer suppression protein
LPPSIEQVSYQKEIDKHNDTRYDEKMIRTFKNRALKKLYEKGDPSKIKVDHIDRVEDILFRLDNAQQSSDMDWPGWNLHPLKGKHKGFWAVRVSGNFRIWFRFEDGDAFDVDYGDYH